ncbi:MAG: helix-turn-helix domain-containing protein [Sphingobacteriia bacterium]|nr:helix-turn-helix domain-containing protein [Sphingobacteriia bacterium]
MLTAQFISHQIETARNELGFTQKTLADKLALSPQTVSKWERGISMPDLITLTVLAKVLNKNVNYFLYESNINEDNENTAEQKSETTVNISDLVTDKIDSIFNAKRWYKQDLSKTFRQNINLTNAVYKRCDMSGTAISDSFVRDCEIDHCNLNEMEINELNCANIYIKHADFSNSNINNCLFKIDSRFCSMTNGIINDTIFEDCKLEIEFNRVIINRVVFKNCRMNHVIFLNCEFDALTFNAVKNCGAKIVDCHTN